MRQDHRRAWVWRLLAVTAVAAALLWSAPAALAQTAPAPTTPAPTTPTTTPTGSTPPTTTAPSGACDHLPTQIARNLCRTATNPAGAAQSVVQGAANNVVATAGDSALRSLTASMASAGKWFLQRIGGLLHGTTTPGITAGWFTNQYRMMLGLAMLIALPMLVIAVMQAIVRSDITQAARSAFIYLPLAAIFSAIGPALAQLLIGTSDWMSAMLGGSASQSAGQFMNRAGDALGMLGVGGANPAVPVFGVLLGAVIVILGALSIWVELLLRSAAIYIAVLFLPLAFAAMVWPSAFRWTRRLIEFLVAIIFAKVFIVAIINLAAAGMASSNMASQFEGVLAGGALLLMAAFTPMALLRLIPLAEAAVVAASTQRLALRQAAAAATGQTGSQVVSQMIQSRFRASTASASTATAARLGGATAAGAGLAAAAGTASVLHNRVESATTLAGGQTPAPAGAGGATGGGAARPLKAPELAVEQAGGPTRDG